MVFDESRLAEVKGQGEAIGNGEYGKATEQSSQLANENTYLRTELEKVTGKVEVLETEIRQLKEKTSVDPFLAGVYPVDTELGLKLAQIHFDTGSAELSPGASRRILAVADWVTKEGIGLSPQVLSDI